MTLAAHHAGTGHRPLVLQPVDGSGWRRPALAAATTLVLALAVALVTGAWPVVLALVVGAVLAGQARSARRSYVDAKTARADR